MANTQKELEIISLRYAQAAEYRKEFLLTYCEDLLEEAHTSVDDPESIAPKGIDCHSREAICGEGRERDLSDLAEEIAAKEIALLSIHELDLYLPMPEFIRDCWLDAGHSQSLL